MVAFVVNRLGTMFVIVSLRVFMEVNEMYIIELKLVSALGLGRCVILNDTIFKSIIHNSSWGTRCEIALSCMTRDLAGE